MSKATEAEMANINVFGNYCDFSIELEEIKVFLDEVLKFISITHLHLQADNIKGHDEETLDNLKYHFQHTQGRVLRKSIIISLVILLESRIDKYCQSFKQYKHLKISYKDFKGDLLDRFKTYSLKVLDSDFDFQSKLWQDIVGMYEVRNCLVHNAGNIENFGKRKSIEEFVRRNQTYTITEFGWLEISNKACHDAIEVIENFSVQIAKFGFKAFPGYYQGINSKYDN